MSNYKLTFKLKQHTPLIHFQHFLPKATLRSTELKSALDKYLIGNYCECWSNDEKSRLKKVLECEELKNFLKHIDNPQKPAFDYDVELVYPAISNKNDNDFKRGESYFGNQMSEDDYYDKTKYKYTVLEKNLITLIIKSPYDVLLKKIDKVIGEFFLLKNFGTRQNKGYGNFYPVEKNAYLKNQNIFPYYFDYDKNNMTYIKYRKGKKEIEYYSVEQIITLFYNTLRSGINLKDYNRNTIFYFKSLMWAYAKKNDEHWDKKSIKSKYLSGEQSFETKKWEKNNSDFNINPEDYPLGYKDSQNNIKHHLWRDILGLSSNEKWKKRIKDKQGKWKDVWKVLEKTHSNEKYTRFKSPIIFKPFMVDKDKYRVFFGVDSVLKKAFNNSSINNISNDCLPTEKEILGQIFNIKFGNNSNLQLKYPDTFDFDKYLKFAIKTYDVDWVKVEYKDKDHNYYPIINGIYNQLKKQLKNKDNETK